MAKGKGPKDERIGTRLGDYEIMSVLATGGMARIYVGKDIKLGREAAVKVLTNDMMEADNTLAERFEREARAVALLDHPNIIPIYQYGEEDGQYFLAMKLVRGHDLADDINAIQNKGEQMAVPRMLHIIRQVAAALDKAHENGIIHRDVKPSNVLIEEGTDRAILTDFGLVLQQTEIDKTMGTAFGTPRYISPEQALASESVVPQSDIYSLAVIVYEILTGSQVFKADTAMQVALSHISDPPPAPTMINPDIPEAVERELLKALEKDADKRHKTATAFIEAIAAAYGQAAKPVAAASPAVKAPKAPKGAKNAGKANAKKGPNLVLFGGLAAAVIVVVLGVLLLAGLGGDNGDRISPSGAGILPEVMAVELGEPEIVEIRYNRQVWALRNVSDAPVSVHQLRVTRDSVIGFDGTAFVNGQRLEPGDCVVMKTAESRASVPDSWNCGTVRNEILRYNDGLFWRGDGGFFRVMPPGGEPVDCDVTQAEGEGVSCALTLPTISG